MDEAWLREARTLVHDLFRPKAWIYWTDWVASATLGYLSFFLAFRIPVWLPQSAWRWPVQGICFAATCLLLYRATIFIHEISHLGNRRELKGFRLIWNLLTGCPLQVPSFMYEPHIHHHQRQTFGTEQDGEYLPFERLSPWALVIALGACVAIPPAVVFRFLVLSPLSWLIPPLRREVIERMSTLAIDPNFRRPAAKRDESRRIFFQEALCLGYLLLLGLLLRHLGTAEGLRMALLAYAVAVTINFINLLRSIGSHRFEQHGEPVSHTEQMLDSVNCTGPIWLTELWGPVGSRLHALHHLFPSLPYHAYPEAHRRLMKHLPPDSPYHAAEYSGLLAVVADLWRRARRPRLVPADKVDGIAA